MKTVEELKADLQWAEGQLMNALCLRHHRLAPITMKDIEYGEKKYAAAEKAYEEALTKE